MKRFIIALLICLPPQAWSLIPLKVAVPTGQDPHIYILNGQIMGEEGRLVDKALRTAGFAPTYEHFPSLRAIERIRKGLVDAVINIKEESLPFAFKSSFAFQFQNCAVTRVANKVRLERIEDFKNHEVAAFKNANTSLGADNISEIIRTAKSYREIQDVATRIKLLNANRVDVMLTEKLVFLHYLEKYNLGAPTDYSFHYLFKPTSYSLIFRSKDHLDQFERHKN